MEDSYGQSVRGMGGSLGGTMGGTMGGTLGGTLGSSTLTSLPPAPQDATLLKLDDYQEPYQALKYAPYYSYSTVVMEMRDMLNKGSPHHGGQ